MEYKVTVEKSNKESAIWTWFKVFLVLSVLFILWAQTI